MKSLPGAEPYLIDQAAGTPYLIRDRGRGKRWHPAMARIARAPAPGLPHHVTQRGNPRMQTFSDKYDETMKQASKSDTMRDAI